VNIQASRIEQFPECVTEDQMAGPGLVQNEQINLRSTAPIFKPVIFFDLILFPFTAKESVRLHFHEEIKESISFLKTNFY